MKTKYQADLVKFVLGFALICFSLQSQAEELDAELDWAELHYVSVPVEGFVEAVLVQVGQRVNQGDKLLQLNTALLSLNVKQARARIAALQPVFADAKREYRDAQVLYEQTVLSEVELQRAKMTFDIASAKLDEANAQLAMHTVLLAHAAQYAPWDAWVSERHLESGQVIVGDLRGQPLIILARADSMVARGYVSFASRSRLHLGQAIDVRYQDKVYSGKLQSMAVSSQSKSDATYALRVVFAVDPATMIRPGDSARLVLP